MDITPPAPSSDRGGASERRGSRGLLAIVVVVGVAFDLWLRTVVGGVAFFAGAVVLAIGLMVYGDVRDRSSVGLLCTAVALAAFPALRTNHDLLALDVMCFGLLVFVAVGVSRDNDLFDLTMVQLVGVTSPGIGEQVRGPRSLARVIRAASPAGVVRDTERAEAVVRGIVLAFPVVVFVGLFLASADAVFASLFQLDVRVGDTFGHVALIAIGASMACGVFAQVANRRHVARPTPSLHLSLTEGVIVLAGLIGVYSLFAFSRLLVSLRGAAYVEEVTDLTYAEYARSGFFQLLWAAGITVAVLMLLRTTIETRTAGERRLIGSLSAASAMLTLVVVHTAIVRLGLYEDAFGLTLLRFASMVMAWWIGVVIVLTAASLAGAWRSRAWLAGAVLCTAAGTLLVVNLVDPEAYVTDRNVQRAVAGEELDLSYLLGLSEDGLVALVDAFDVLAPEDVERVTAYLCAGADDDGAVRWNLAAQRLAAQRRLHC
jgi:hypothetical protein